MRIVHASDVYIDVLQTIESHIVDTRVPLLLQQHLTEESTHHMNQIDEKKKLKMATEHVKHI